MESQLNLVCRGVRTLGPLVIEKRRGLESSRALGMLRCVVSTPRGVCPLCTLDGLLWTWYSPYWTLEASRCLCVMRFGTIKAERAKRAWLSKRSAGTRSATQWKKILAVDICPQANLSELFLGGLTNHGSKNLLTIQGKLPRCTIGGYFQIRLPSPYNVPAFNAHDFIR